MYLTIDKAVIKYTCFIGMLPEFDGAVNSEIFIKKWTARQPHPVSIIQGPVVIQQ
jgi:hypothetical protein